MPKRIVRKDEQTKEKTIETLARECNITQEEAEEYIRLHWQEENETN